MAWVQRGLVFVPDGSRSWARSHAQVPTAIEIDGRVRVYYAARDESSRSRTSFVDLSASNLNEVLYVHDRPVIDLGDPGTHDEDGAMVGHVVAAEDGLRMYYTGWSRGATVPYRVSVGLAISRDGGLTFERRFAGPVVDRTPDEPFMTMSPYVRRMNEGWMMWYGSGTRWVEIDRKLEPIYVVKAALSDDGVRWRQPNLTCIAPGHELEANTRPSVFPTQQGLEMWFSYRHSERFRDGAGAYRIGYAVSPDGVSWTRKDDPAGLEPAASGWNAAAMAYPNVVEIGGRKIMFHNGNGFGRSGFGYAEWVPDRAS